MRAAGLAPSAIILEPVARSTAPAAAALVAAGVDPETCLLLAPSDHVVRDTGAFHRTVGIAREAALDGTLVTFGITSDRPETGYGYRRFDKAATTGGLPDGAYRVERFIEKPDAAAAAALLAAGGALWNSGMFLFRADALIEEFERLAPAMLDACRRAVAGATQDLDFLRLDGVAFGECPAGSIDYTVMEKASRVAVVPVDMGWNDIGSWQALWQENEKDSDGNVLIGDVLAHDVKRSYVRAERRLVAVLGLADVVVVTTDDAVFAAPMDRAPDVRAIVDRLNRAGRAEATALSKVYRPWGYYQSVDADDRFQVKRIVVKPGGRLLLQMHRHRAEHWVVVSGTAEVTRGEETLMLTENESIYVPLGTTHRLANPGKIPLHLIGVQTGSYLGEDDIVRFDDTYGRT